MGNTKPIEEFDDGDYVLIDGQAWIVGENISPEDSETGSEDYELEASDVFTRQTNIKRTYAPGTLLEVPEVKIEELEVVKILFDSMTAELKNGLKASVWRKMDAEHIYEQLSDKEEWLKEEPVTALVISALGKHVVSG